MDMICRVLSLGEVKITLKNASDVSMASGLVVFLC